MTRAFQDYLNNRTLYRYDQLQDVLDIVRKHFKFSWCNKKLKYYDVPCSFDIEASSFYTDSGLKASCMYVWSFCIYGLVIVGRTWDEWLHLCSDLVEILDLSDEKRLIIYVHNLSYDFQFFRHWLDWKTVFSLDVRKPLYALTWSGLEFRCSYLLSGYNLEHLGKNLKTYYVRKMVGDLDYRKIRTPATPLTKREWRYVSNDVRVVVAYIMETIAQDGGISKIPLTKTGYVRTYMRNRCFYTPGVPRKKDFKRLRYKEFISKITMDPDEYLQLKRGFQGGFTHGNPYYAKLLQYGVDSDDLTSSYPTELIADPYPMSAAEKVTIHSKAELEENCKLYCCLFDVEFTGLEPKIWYENYISLSRCFYKENVTVQNGRVVKADCIRTTITEQDYFIIDKFYKWKGIRVSNFRRYYKDYLPKEIILGVLHLYEQKTVLKGVVGKETEYMLLKGMLNSVYGMMVTDPLRDEIPYTDDWGKKKKPELEAAIEKYNNSPGRFNAYQWGVWCTAYARRNLFTAILALGEDYRYSDTDSVKYVNREKHLEYFKEYNKRITAQLEKALDYYDIPHDKIRPKNQKGEEKPLGVWDYEGRYQVFKTLGAKRYIGMKHYKPEMTVAGIRKVSLPYLVENYGKYKLMSKFDDQLYIPADKTGKLSHVYLDSEMHGVVTDYLGNDYEYYEKSGVHMEPQDYTLKMSADYVDYITGLREGVII